MEKVIHLSKGANTQDKQKVSPTCTIGEVLPREPFGLREVLYQEVRPGGTIATQCQYSAKHPDVITKLVQISYRALKKAMKPSDLKMLVSKFRQEYGQVSTKESRDLWYKA